MQHEEIKVANQDNLNEVYCPLPLSVIPNHMGINLCSVESVAWIKQDDGQLVSLTINFSSVPEGCTPTDAMVLRRANHALADESCILQEVLSDLYQQVKKFTEKEGEADFYTGPAVALLSKLQPLEYKWAVSSPTAEEVLHKFAERMTPNK